MQQKNRLSIFLVIIISSIFSFSSVLSTHHRWRTVDGNSAPFQSYREVEEYLKSAQVLSMERVGFGIAQTQKVTLEKDGIRMHGAFRTVKKDIYIPHPLHPSFLQNHRDDCRFEIAAYKLSQLLGVDFVPPTVPRRIKGKRGSLQAWVENCLMETQRRGQQLHPPDEWHWIAQMLTMHLWDNLVGNLDRHQGNLLIGSDWEVWLIDHTQAFRRYKKLHSRDKLVYCDRKIWERLIHLDATVIQKELAEYLRQPELDALVQRRELIIQKIRELIDQKGEDKVLF